MMQVEKQPQAIPVENQAFAVEVIPADPSIGPRIRLAILERDAGCLAVYLNPEEARKIRAMLLQAIQEVINH